MFLVFHTNFIAEYFFVYEFLNFSDEFKKKNHNIFFLYFHLHIVNQHRPS